MTVWAVCPSAAPIPQARLCFQAWKDQGYHVAAFVNDHARIDALPMDLGIHHERYDGYAKSINRLAGAVIGEDEDCQIIVAMADDIWPDQKLRADEIAEQFLEHFGTLRGKVEQFTASETTHLLLDNSRSLGVMQPTGDRWTIEGTVPQIDKAAMSPWMGREWCRRAYCGKGPLWPGYRHCFVDNDLQEVAKKLGLFQQRLDITHLHQHWLRIGNSIPDHARHTVGSWDADQALFMERQAAGFPESELLP